MPIKKEINRPLMKLFEICSFVIIIKNLKMLKKSFGRKSVLGVEKKKGLWVKYIRFV